MLTRLHIKGFKNLLDVDIRFGPFTCIAGRNAAGKSNLFDAIRFLHLLTQHPIADAARLVRETKGRRPEPRSLFTAFGDFVAQEMSFTADLLIERNVQDDLGVPAQAATSSVRYEVAFRWSHRDNTEYLELARESLKPLAGRERKPGFPASRGFAASTLSGRRAGDFVSTSLGDRSLHIKVHQDGTTGRRIALDRAPRTIIGGLAMSDFPTILAVHREMESWRTLFLEPAEMRSPSSPSDESSIDRHGANLPATIDRMRRNETGRGYVLTSLSNKLAELIDEVREVNVRTDEGTQTLLLEVRGRDGVLRPAVALSDGTLRFLVLATLAIDPEAKGLLCLEEPENGIHPERVPAMVRLLKDIAVDPGYPVDPENPLRQVVINTHSPAVVSAVAPDDIVYLDETNTRLAGTLCKVAVPRVISGTWRSRIQKDSLPLSFGQVRPYLVGFPQETEGQILLDIFEP